MSSPRMLLKSAAIEAGHSDEYTNEILSYFDKLESAGLPVIFSLSHFALLLNVELEKVKNLIAHRAYYYKKYEIKKKRGGTREISSPYSVLKELQQWIDKSILAKVETHSLAFGFCTGKSIVDNARVHLNQDFILNVDLLNFFDTISERRVFGIFKSLGYQTNLAVYFAQLCTVELNEEVEEVSVETNCSPTYPLEKIFEDLQDIIDEEPQSSSNSSIYIKKQGVLPQGAPTSPRLSNLVCRRLDKRLAAYANKNGFKYTRYADDLTFSGKGSVFPKISVIKKIIEGEDFKLNEKKIKFYNSNSNKKIVTGLIVGNEVRVPKKYKHEIERHLFFCEKLGAAKHISYMNEKYGKPTSFYREWLLGKICFLKMVEPILGNKLLDQFNRIDWGF